jgi:hypothetical protein
MRLIDQRLGGEAHVAPSVLHFVNAPSIGPRQLIIKLDSQTRRPIWPLGTRLEKGGMTYILQHQADAKSHHSVVLPPVAIISRGATQGQPVTSQYPADREVGQNYTFSQILSHLLIPTPNR